MAECAELELTLSHKEFLKIDRNYSQAASIASLVYVSDKEEGIIRIKKGKGFSYSFLHKPLRSRAEIMRIKKLAIPPSWTSVWICPLPNGHIQATGMDLRNRKQYRYHALWNKLRNETKFHHLYEFGNALPKLRQRIQHDIAQKELTQEKVIATVISLMEKTYIRIGNNDYEKLYGSYGLTTLKDKHASINGDKVHFSFKGKKGVMHNITIKNKKLASIVKACRDIPGKELFQYYAEDGKRKTIDSGIVNEYIKNATGMNFTAKDFRTWAGSLQALQAFCTMGEALTESECKKNIVAMLNWVSKKLGNTGTVCKKYYVHPGLIRLYEEKKLMQYLAAHTQPEKPVGNESLTNEEKILLQILKKT